MAGSGPSLASVKLDFSEYEGGSSSPGARGALVPHASSTMSSAMQSPVAFHPTVSQTSETAGHVGMGAAQCLCVSVPASAVVVGVLFECYAPHIHE